MIQTWFSGDDCRLRVSQGREWLNGCMTLSFKSRNKSLPTGSEPCMEVDISGRLTPRVPGVIFETVVVGGYCVTLKPANSVIGASFVEWFDLLSHC